MLCSGGAARAFMPRTSWVLPTGVFRLFDLIRRTRASGVIFISGDRHHVELSRIGLGYLLYDLTSISLNQVRIEQLDLNRHRVGEIYFEPNFGLITVDWDVADSVLSLQIRDVGGVVVLRHDIALSVDGGG